jgi:predicted enzyme related to lactoylglutathione lyase
LITLGAVVLDAAELEPESAFWHRMLGGTIEKKASHHILRIAGSPVVAVQLAPGHIPPEWPDGQPQQMHVDLMVDDIGEADARARDAGARRLRPTEDVDPVLGVGFRVYASPAGHPFCLTWG